MKVRLRPRTAHDNFLPKRYMYRSTLFEAGQVYELPDKTAMELLNLEIEYNGLLHEIFEETQEDAVVTRGPDSRALKPFSADDLGVQHRDPSTLRKAKDVKGRRLPTKKQVKSTTDETVVDVPTDTE